MIDKNKPLTSVELFAGCGGLALGLKWAGFDCLMYNDNNRACYHTLRNNLPESYNIDRVICCDIDKLDNKLIEHLVAQNIDLLSGGPPCQSFSIAGLKKGLSDKRGQQMLHFIDKIKQIKPKMVLIENVPNLMLHNKGQSLNEILRLIEKNHQYKVLAVAILDALNYRVPQKRKRLFIVAQNLDYYSKEHFIFPNPYQKKYTIKDALQGHSDIYNKPVTISEGAKYPLKKEMVLELVPPGGSWVNLPLEVQKEYMGKSFYNSGGNRGIARRMSWDEPCLTLTTSPSQMRTERCHPSETRPFCISEYARLQTFPDDFIFYGSKSDRYKQIGNAVPVNLAHEIGMKLYDYILTLEEVK